jgi:hypothetical protein
MTKKANKDFDFITNRATHHTLLDKKTRKAWKKWAKQPLSGAVPGLGKAEYVTFAKLIMDALSAYNVTPDAFAALVVQHGLVEAAKWLVQHNAKHEAAAWIVRNSKLYDAIRAMGK